MRFPFAISVQVNKLTSAGCVFKFWVADWFAMLNNKVIRGEKVGHCTSFLTTGLLPQMDGDLKKIRLVGEYMIEVWKAAGMNMDNVEFLWASDEINKRAEEYWSKVMDIAMRFNLKRVLRCCTIMGRAVMARRGRAYVRACVETLCFLFLGQESDEMSAAQIMYPVMQCTDIFFLQVLLYANRPCLVWFSC
jgi:tyrosyl-tRNA synthetase